MSTLIINLLSAMAISLVITSMVAVKSPRAKSIILVLPIPITIALLGSGGRATSLSIIGLALTNCFVWAVVYLHKRGWHILVADILMAILYVTAAYVITKTIHPAFAAAASLYLIAWGLTMVKLADIKHVNHKQAVAKAPLFLRPVIIFFIAFILFSLKQYLAAFVVTFPYNTIFAVYENRENLVVQAALFSRNSLALAVYFIANYYFTRSGAHWYAYVASWIAFAGAIMLISRKLPVSIIVQHS